MEVLRDSLGFRTLWMLGKFLHQISLRSRDEDGKLSSIEFKTYWRRILSITLQRCNSSVLAKKIDRIVCSNDSVDDSYKHQMAVC